MARALAMPPLAMHGQLAFSSHQQLQLSHRPACSTAGARPRCQAAAAQTPSSSSSGPLGRAAAAAQQPELPIAGPSSPTPSGLIIRAARLPNQAESVFNPIDSAVDVLIRLPVTDAPTKSVSDLDYLAVRHTPLVALVRAHCSA